MWKIKGAAILAISLFTGFSAGSVTADTESARSRTQQLIIQLDQDTNRRIQSVKPDQVVPDIRLPNGEEVILRREIESNVLVVQLPEEISLDEAQRLSEQLAGYPGIAAVEPDKRYFPALVPNDPEYPPGVNAIVDPGQWHLFEDTAGIRMPAAWDRTTGSSAVVVAVLDTGIITHRDLDAARLLPGYDFFSGGLSNLNTQLDNDPILGDPLGRDNNPTDPGDATVDDECEPGWVAEDSSWHGLSVTGVIFATSDNNTDIAGMDFSARLLPIRVLGKCGGSLSDVADAIRWAAGLSVTGVPDNPNPANVINLSLSGDGACSQFEQNAIDAAVAVGAVVVVSAGNESVNASGVSPANCDNVVTVGAIGRDGRIASYTNFGANVDFTAPGGEDPDGVLTLSNFGTTTAGADALAVITGTSFTTAQASAVASLMFAVNPALSPSVLEDVMKATTRAFPDPSCNTLDCGTGVLDANAAMAGAADPSSVLPGNVNIGGGGGGGGCAIRALPAAYDPVLVLILAFAVLLRAFRRHRG